MRILGWKVELYRLPLLPAFYRAVVLPGGEHQIEFRYEPWSFRIGGIFFLVTQFFILLVFGGSFVRHPKLAPFRAVTSTQILQHQ